jgi:hypothetical protein
MLEIKEEHIKEAKECYFKNKKFFLQEIPYYQTISEEEIIMDIADTLAFAEKRMKELDEKYPNFKFPWEIKK